MAELVLRLRDREMARVGVVKTSVTVVPALRAARQRVRAFSSAIL